MSDAVHDKLDRLLVDVAVVKRDVAAIAKSHVRLQDAVRPLEQHVERVQGVVKTTSWCAGVAAAVAGVLKAMGVI